MPDNILLTSEPLSLKNAQDTIGDPSAGAQSFFVGTTRDNFDGKLVKLLEYEAYNDMAVKQMNSLCNSVREKWPALCNIAIHHRLGIVSIGEASVIIAVSAPHRREAIGSLHNSHSALPYNVIRSLIKVWLELTDLFFEYSLTPSQTF